MNIEKTYRPGDDFVVLRVICPPLPDKNISVSVAALVAGTITLEDEIARETSEAQNRLKAYELIAGML